MDIQCAREILELPNNFSLNQLKQNYRVLALKHHPDKNNSSKEATRKFQEVKEAYDYLRTYLKIKEENISQDYDSLLHIFVNSLFSNISNSTEVIDIIKNIAFNCKKISLKIFEGLDKEKALLIYEFISQYHTVLHIDDEILEQLTSVLKDKIKDDNIIILNPSLEDLFDNNIYKLDYDDNTYCIPLWHNELYYKLENDKELIVKCIPELPKHISIDYNNDIFVYLRTNIQSLLEKKTIPVIVENKQFDIPIKELHIKRNQIYTFKNQGISIINNTDIFDIKQKSSVHIKIDLG